MCTNCNCKDTQEVLLECATTLRDSLNFIMGIQSICAKAMNSDNNPADALTELVKLLQSDESRNLNKSLNSSFVKAVAIATKKQQFEEVINNVSHPRT